MRATLRYPILAATMLFAAAAGGQSRPRPSGAPPGPPSGVPGGPPAIAPPVVGAPPVAPQVGVPDGYDGESIGRLADSMARLGTEMSRLAVNRHQMNTDEFERTRDSLKAQMEGLKAAMSERVHEVSVFGHQGDGRRGRHGSIADLLDRVRHDPDAIELPAADSFVAGGLTIPAGTRRSGTAATVNGDLDVFGTVDGNAVAVAGNVILHPGSHVTGSAFAAGGQVRMDGGGGLVDGEVRSLEGPLGAFAVATSRTPAGHRSRMHDFRLAFSIFALVMLLVLGVLTFAEDQLDQVATTLADRFGKSAWYGIVGEIAALPVFLLLVVGLAITLIGILAIPFASAGYFVLLAGTATLGFVAVAEATGTAVLRRKGQASLTPRGAQVRAVVAGIGVYGVLWMLTAIVGSQSAIGVTVRGIVVVVTIVAITVGFGAVLLWRFELRRARRKAIGAPETPVDQSVWITPTPVTGVAAARRPTPAADSTPGSKT